MSIELSPQIALAERLPRPCSVIVPDASRIDLARAISGWTIKAAEDKKMLPKTPEEILDLFGKSHSIVTVDDNGNPLSHVAATFIYPDRRVEIGALCTNPDSQEKGFGRGVVTALLTHLNRLYPDPDNRFFALANEDSIPLFRKVGGEKMDPSELHKDVWVACEKCPRRQSGAKTDGNPHCCDTPIDLTNAVRKMQMQE
ncbi:MAG: GNAT family N-acetyltransferase [Candidatus Levybacteria bacterium]|nr:GNAT family N-acetyltransferase [Candidatus Levybacteria bacterium]